MNLYLYLMLYSESIPAEYAQVLNDYFGELL